MGAGSAFSRQRTTAPWLVLLGAIVVTAIVPGLRHEALLVPPACAEGQVSTLLGLPGRLQKGQWESLHQRIPGFVEEYHPLDPEMLLGAGSLMQWTDPSTSLDLLERAVEAGGGEPAWVAYADMLFKHEVPSYDRLGIRGTDPGDPEMVAIEEYSIEYYGQPTAVSEEQGERLLEMLAKWQREDPDNGLPLALEAWCLYGLHRDEEAFAAWQRAAQKPVVSTHWGAGVHAAARVLVAMGVPEADGLFGATTIRASVLARHLRSCARIAFHEGRLAQLEGRPEDAVTWWNATIELATRHADSAETVIAYMSAVSVLQLGAAPAWMWHAEWAGTARRAPAGPEQRTRRLYHGRQHEFYVGQVGESADGALRERLLLEDARREHVSSILEAGGLTRNYQEGLRLSAVAYAVVLLMLALLAIWLAVCSWRREAADAATHLTFRWQAALALAPFAPIVYYAFGVLREPFNACAIADPHYGAGRLLDQIVLSGALLVVLLCLGATADSRREGAPLGDAWKGNLRRVLPLTLAVGAVLYLGLIVAALHTKRQWADRWNTPGISEMAYLQSTLGEAWRNPRLDPDSWRDEDPPDRESD